MHAGLDARAAAIVMRTVRNIVNTGRTIVCTIHQPSIDIFESFDELLLLKRGGETIFNGQLGHHSSHLIDYFQVNLTRQLHAEIYHHSTVDVNALFAAQRASAQFIGHIASATGSQPASATTSVMVRIQSSATVSFERGLLCAVLPRLHGLHSWSWLLGVQGVKGAPAIEEGMNPATWMLEVTTPGMESKLGVSFAEYYASSDLAK